MQCPQCKSRSVIQKGGQKRCEAKGCTYIRFHMISYQNQNRVYEGQKTIENRFTSTGPTTHTGEKQALRYERNFYRGSTVIKDLIYTMKLSSDLQERAQAKLIQVLRIKYPDEKNGSQQKQKGFNISDTHLGAYCLWLACYDREMYFKDVRIANQMGITKEAWGKIHNQMQKKFKSILNIPVITIDMIIKRICRKRKINQIQQDAMIQMAKNIKKAQKIGGKTNSTVAACIFWQIMIRSSTYNKDGNFDLRQYLQKCSKNNEEQNTKKYWTQTEFDISFETIKRFKNQQLGSGQELENLIPHFKTRIPVPQEKGKNFEGRL